MFRIDVRSRLRRRQAAALLAMTLLLGGCVNLGPTAVQASRADYNSVLRDTADEQLLANLVRLRYRDRPYFLEVTAVTTQYAFSPQLSASAALGPGNVDQEGSASGSIGYAEQPTISYAPLQGDEFARHLLTPVSPDALLLLANSGWSVERLMRLCVQRINGIPNATTAAGPTPDAAPEYEAFHRIAKLLRQLQLSGDLMVGYTQDEHSHPILKFSERSQSGDAYARLVDALGLSPGQPHYRIVPAIGDAAADSVAIQTRSLNGILYYLSHAVAVPETHRSEGLVTLTRRSDGAPFDWSELMTDFFSVRVADDRPGSAAVRVPYRDHWFYIADADLSSKSTFSLLVQLFALQAGSADGARPLITIPVGG